MKNLLLIGDSIRLGYQGKLEELIGDEFKIYKPDVNCQFTKFALWNMWAWMNDFGYPKIDVALWGLGAWDLHRVTADGEIFTPVDEYAYYQRRMAIQMKKYTDNVIFVNMPAAGKGLDKEPEINPLINTNPNFVPVRLTAPTDVWNADVRLYNARATEVMNEMGIPVVDFYSAIAVDTDRYVCEDGVHMTDEGYSVLANLAADAIRKYSK